MATDYECELYYDRCMELEATVSTLRAQLAERERECEILRMAVLRVLEVCEHAGAELQTTNEADK